MVCNCGSTVVLTAVVPASAESECIYEAFRGAS